MLLDVPTPGELEKLENAGAEYAKLRSARVIRAKGKQESWADTNMAGTKVANEGAVVENVW